MSSPHRPVDPRSGLVLDTHELGRRAGAMRVIRATVDAPADLGIAVIGVPPGIADRARSSARIGGRGSARQRHRHGRGPGRVRAVPWVRSLDQLEVDIQELFVYPGVEPDDDLASRLQGDLIDLEPLLRDEVVLDLPFQPLCRDNCLGLCLECGANLNENPDHRHETGSRPSMGSAPRS